MPTQKQINRKKLIWRHNGFLGTVAMTEKGMRAIVDSTTATFKAKQLAYDIALRCDALRKSLKERVDAN